MNELISRQIRVRMIPQLTNKNYANPKIMVLHYDGETRK